MSRPSILLVLAITGALGLLEASPGAEVDRLLREGQAAFERGDLNLAAALYERAQERTTDPALLAFDLACVQYRLALASGAPGLLVEAEQNYRCCLDPTDSRRAAALYGLGNCLLARAGGHDVSTLAEAVEVYEKCLREPELPAEFAAEARYNRERARLELMQARAAPATSTGNPPPGPDPDTRTAEVTPLPRNDSLDVGEQRPGKLTGDPEPGKGKDGNKSLESNDPPPPGKGTLPPIPEDEQAIPLSSREAAAHLDQAAARIRTEHHQALRAKAARAPVAGVRDW